jgi:hypothetical protein
VCISEGLPEDKQANKQDCLSNNGVVFTQASGEHRYSFSRRWAGSVPTVCQAVLRSACAETDKIVSPFGQG